MAGALGLLPEERAQRQHVASLLFERAAPSSPSCAGHAFIDLSGPKLARLREMVEAMRGHATP